MFWLTISHQYGKDKNGLIKALENGLFSINPDYEGASKIALLNNDKTCFMRVFDSSLPEYIKKWFNEKL